MRILILICSFWGFSGTKTLVTGVSHEIQPRELMPPFLGGRRVKSMQNIQMPSINSATFAANDALKCSKSFPKMSATKNDNIGSSIKKDNSNEKRELGEQKILNRPWKKDEKKEEMEKSYDEPLAVTRFREYLRINTEQPNPDYQKCRDFLFNYAAELGLHPWEYECVPVKIFVGMTFAGSDPSLPALLLYSHSDVFPTMASKWTHPPYDAHKDALGNIYARGAQDMKSVGVQYMEALRLLIDANGHKPFLRTVHVLWGPDEEIGGHDGMEKFVRTDKFRALNVGFALDEGLASETDVYRVFYGERAVWSPGHGSRFIEDSAGPKLSSILSSVNEYRESQYRKLREDSKLNLGAVTSINLTKAEVIPSKCTAYFDVRVTPTDNYEELEAIFAEWCAKAGANVTYEFDYKSVSKSVTPVDPSENGWWRELSEVFAEEKCKISTEIFVGGTTDSRFLREAGIPAIGFSPMINTPVLLHDHNEFLNERVFMDGVKLYGKIIARLANLRA